MELTQLFTVNLNFKQNHKKCERFSCIISSTAFITNQPDVLSVVQVEILFKDTSHFPLSINRMQVN